MERNKAFFVSSFKMLNKFPRAIEYFSNTVYIYFSLHNSVAKEILNTMNKKKIGVS